MTLILINLITGKYDMSVISNNVDFLRIWMISLNANGAPPPRHQPFYGLFSGMTRVSRCQKKLFLDCIVPGRIARGWHTNNPGGCHSIRTSQPSTSVSPPILLRMPFLPQPFQFYPGLGQAQEYAGLHTPVAWLNANGAMKLMYFITFLVVFDEWIPVCTAKTVSV